MNDIQFITVAVPSSKIGALYATLGTLLGATALASTGTIAAPLAAAPSPSPAPTSAVEAAPAPAADQSTGAIAGTVAGDDTVDAAGWPWSADLHASTKGTTKEGLWRMKVGVSRPDPKPGFPKADGGTGTTETGTASQAAAPVAIPAVDEDDEFAAFRQAAAANVGTAPAEVAARTWTDADLGALCNQAATKLGDPAPVVKLIGEYVPEGVKHSRNIPEAKRAEFAAAIEKVAGIEFAG